ncbi:hypothetical protein NC651_030891 [Populus alba x Populus x berolinensis]|nr:hypothetical protein NC651_030891 [Populus alba x Populus x berolinensis]
MKRWAERHISHDRVTKMCADSLKCCWKVLLVWLIIMLNLSASKLPFFFNAPIDNDER